MKDFRYSDYERPSFQESYNIPAVIIVYILYAFWMDYNSFASKIVKSWVYEQDNLSFQF